MLPKCNPWQLFADNFFDTCVVQSMSASVVRCTSIIVRPIASTKRRIQLLRAAGERIVFASDMYLPQDAIQCMLLNAAIAAPGDPVYVSSELGVNKRSVPLDYGAGRGRGERDYPPRR